jgi:hypothetical protein
MVSKFERIFFTPLVYQTFTIKDEENDRDEEFVIQDLPQDLYEQAATFMIEYYMKDETFQKAAQVSEDALKEFYRFVFEQKVSIVCFKKGTKEILGLNALSVKTKGVDTSFQVRISSLNSSRSTIQFHFRPTMKSSEDSELLLCSSTATLILSITTTSLIICMLMAWRSKLIIEEKESPQSF